MKLLCSALLVYHEAKIPEEAVVIKLLLMHTWRDLVLLGVKDLHSQAAGEPRWN